MSVIIKDMGKPEFCFVLIDGKFKYCPFVNTDDDCVLQLEKGICEGTWADQYSKCPLIEAPEPCVDTIDALNESIKHFDDMAEECRRNANIERNDYMDMRDDAAEYRQLSIWLNELKWLRERFQSQSEQKWIPVSKKLPKEDVPVLVTDDAGGMATVGIDSCGRYEDTGERFWYTSQNVTAWMYTVEPYRGEQE